MSGPKRNIATALSSISFFRTHSLNKPEAEREADDSAEEPADGFTEAVLHIGQEQHGHSQSSLPDALLLPHDHEKARLSQGEKESYRKLR